MEKRHLRNLLLGGALAAGLGVATERGCDKEDAPPPKPGVGQIHEPNTTDETKPELVVRGTRENIRTTTMSAPPENTVDKNVRGDSFPDDLINAIHQSFGEIPIFRGEREESGAIPGSFFTSMAPGDNFLQYGGFGRYFITRYQGEQLSGDGETWFATQTVIQITGERDGTWTIGHPTHASIVEPKFSANCDNKSLADALSELQEYETLVNGHGFEYDPVRRENTPEGLQRRLEHYQQKKRNLEEVKRKAGGWRFLWMTDQQRGHIDALIEEYNQEIEATLNKIKAIY